MHSCGLLPAISGLPRRSWNWSYRSRVRAGFTGIEGFRMAVQHNRAAGETVEPDIEREVVAEDWNTPPKEILQPFFEQVWEAFGLERPDSLG